MIVLRFEKVRRKESRISIGRMVFFVLCLWYLSLCKPAVAIEECIYLGEDILSKAVSKMKDCEKVGILETYFGKGIFDYMDGGAPLYLNQGLQCLWVQEVSRNSQVFIIELYQFKNKDGAHKVYLEDTSGNENKIIFGEEGSFDNGYVAFYRNHFIAKIMCLGDCGKYLVDSGSLQNMSMEYLLEVAKYIDNALIIQVGRDLESQIEKPAKKGVSKDCDCVVLIGASYAKGLQLEKIAEMTLINKGVSGEQSFEMKARFYDDVLSMKPRAVIIWGFINDIFRAKKNEIEPTLERTKKNIVEMAELAIRNGIVPILATEVTIRGKDSWSETVANLLGRLLGNKSYQDYVNEQVFSINRWMKNYAEQNAIVLLDLQKVISDENGDREKEYAAKDGSHISQEGYEKLATYIEDELAKYLEP